MGLGSVLFREGSCLGLPRVLAKVWPQWGMSGFKLCSAGRSIFAGLEYYLCGGILVVVVWEDHK